MVQPGWVQMKLRGGLAGLDFDGLGLWLWLGLGFAGDEFGMALVSISGWVTGSGRGDEVGVSWVDQESPGEGDEDAGVEYAETARPGSVAMV